MRLWLALLYCAVLSGQTGLEQIKANARALFVSGSFEASSQQWEQALAEDPNDYEVRLNYGIVLDALGRYLEANEQLTAAARLRATVPVLNNLAINQAHLGRAKEAARMLEQVLQADPRNASALYNLGRIEMERGNWEAAIRLLNAAARVVPSDAEVATSLGKAHCRLAERLVREGRIEESIAHFQTALELTHGESGVYVGASMAMVRGNNPTAALTVLEEASRRFPSEIRVPLAMGYVYQTQGNWADAEEWYRKALLMDPRSIYAAVALGRTLHLSGHTEQAVGLLKSVAEANPQSAMACYELAHALLSGDETSEEGLTWMRRAAELAPGSPEPQYAMAKAAFARGNLAEAERWASRAASTDPKFDPAHYLLASIYRRQNKQRAAAAELLRFKQLKDKVRSREDPEVEQMLEGARASH